MVLLRKIAGRFEAIHRAMRTVAHQASRGLTIASTVWALLLWLTVSPLVFAMAATARGDRGHSITSFAASVVWINPFIFAAGSGAVGSATITVDHTKAGSADHTDFPVHIVETKAALKSVANGGDLTSVNNFAIYTDSGHTTLADFERVFHDLTTGSIHYVVRLPSYSHTADSLLYAQWDASTTDRSAATSVWTANNWGSMVHHYGDGTTLTLNDSTSNARNGTGKDNTLATVSLAAGSGKVGGGLSLPSGTKAEWTAVNGSAITAFSYALWVNPNSNAATVGFADWDNNNISLPFFLIQNNAGNLRFYVDGSYREASSSVSTGTWYRVGITLSVSGGTGTWKFYRNGSLLSTYTGGLTNQANAINIVVGLGFNGWQTGSYDESNLVMGTVHSADRMLADYNSMVSGFYTWT
jgi:hypothetical protein